jgi:uncharacterized protein with HEPN domain
MNDRDRQRLDDIAAAIAVIGSHLQRGDLDTNHAISQHTVDHDLPVLGAAIARLLDEPEQPQGGSF